MKIKSERDFWSGLVFLVAGVAFVVAAMNDPVGSAAQPGPGYFRLLPSAALATLGVVVLFKALTFEHDGGDPIGRIAWSRPGHRTDAPGCRKLLGTSVDQHHHLDAGTGDAAGVAQAGRPSSQASR